MNMKSTSNPNKVVIFGTGDFAQVAHFYLTHDSPYEVVAFTADEAFIKEKELWDLPLVPFEDITRHYPPDQFQMLIAIAYSHVNKVRVAKYYEAKNKGYELITYVSSKVTRWGDLEIGDNCFIFEDQTIQPFVKIGNNVVVWSGNHLGHHCVIGDHCFIASHVVISGRVKIGPSCFVGINVSIRDGITIARECVIGAGAVIVKSTQEKGVYIGKAAELYTDDSSKLKKI